MVTGRQGSGGHEAGDVRVEGLVSVRVDFPQIITQAGQPILSPDPIQGQSVIRKH